MSTVSPGSSRCSSKQKHWILLKYAPACIGATLYVATPMIGSSEWLVASKKASAVCPASTLTCRCTGLKLQGRLVSTSVLNEIVSRRLLRSVAGSAGKS
eukprot:scaffold111564_cov75-Phaeocystis_antarctica.AAC.2